MRKGIFNNLRLSAIMLLIVCLLMPNLTAYAVEVITPSGIPFSELESQIDAIVAEHTVVAN